MKVKRFVLAIDKETGKITNTYDLDIVSEAEKIILMQKVMNEGMERLGYEKNISK